MKVMVLLDTNSLIHMAKGVPLKECIEEEIKTIPVYACPESVLRELEVITDRQDALARKAELARRIAEKTCLVLPSKSELADDDLLVNAVEAREKGYTVIVATSDRSLRKKLRRHGIITAYYREKKNRFELEYQPLL